MIAEIFRFELREQLRAPLFWIVAVLFALLGFALMSSDAASLVGGMGIGDGLCEPEGCDLEAPAPELVDRPGR